MAQQLILAADIGGTKTLLRVSELSDASLLPIYENLYQSQAYSSFESMLEEFFTRAGIPHNSPIRGACFAVAGPVEGHHARLTNLAWSVDSRQVTVHFNISDISLINDFEAIGFGIEALREQDLLVLQPGERHTGSGTRAIVGAGTGLGVTWVNYKERKPLVHASEGGHADFAPTDETQLRLWRYLQKKHGRVSYERVVSGPGLIAIFEFLCSEGMQPSDRLTQSMQDKDPAAAITECASAHQDALALQVLDIFASAYGAFTGNIALTVLPYGGVYLAGGIAAKIADILGNGRFLQAFNNKGRFSNFVKMFPVYIIKNPKVGLLGAGLVASHLAK